MFDRSFMSLLRYCTEAAAKERNQKPAIDEIVEIWNGILIWIVKIHWLLNLMVVVFGYQRKLLT